MNEQSEQPSCTSKPYCPLTIARQWWPMLLPLIVMAGIYAARAAGEEELIAKPIHETIAMCLLSGALAVAIKGCIATRERFAMVLAALCLVFLLREIHFYGTDKLLYIGVAAIGIWSALWAKSILPTLIDKPRGRWLIVVIWTYAIALLVQRRGLKFLPDEKAIHVQLEEVLENLGHLFLLILGLFSPARPQQDSQSQSEAKPQGER